MPTAARDLPGPLSVEVASLLRQRIAALNIDQKTVAERSQINESTLSRLLNNKKPIYLEQLDALCAALGLEIGGLLDAADRATRRRRLRLMLTPAHETYEHETYETARAVADDAPDFEGEDVANEEQP